MNSNSFRRENRELFPKRALKNLNFLCILNLILSSAVRIMEVGRDRFLNHQEVRRGFTNRYSLPCETHRGSFPEEKSRTWRNTSYQWFNRLVNCTIHILVKKQISRSEYNM